ncbi:MAG: type IV-A pilus assembly ATPase PilB [Bdellovibrionaceae bacterium]|nr:type IV-A pilus assembly ATPase PilB [Pseudobdellovibrionaceae bacterium]
MSEIKPWDKKTCDILYRQGLIKPEQYEQALETKKTTPNLLLTQILINLNFVQEAQVQKGLEAFYNIQGINLSQFQIDQAVIDLVPRDICYKHNVIPVQRMLDNQNKVSTVVIAFSDPSQILVREDLRIITKAKVIQPIVASPIAIQGALEKYYGISVDKALEDIEGEDAEFDVLDDKKVETIDNITDKDSPVVKFVNAILNEAMKKRASDIHFEPYEKIFRVRYRVDGILIEAKAPPRDWAPSISARIKIMAKLDIAEKRRPQDGRLKVRTREADMDFRVSTMPTLWGEKAVLRLLDKSNLQLDMTKLGFEEEDLRLFKSCINLPQGLVLITGPTGSGKTTTIYSALSELNKTDVNISTAEDPVEFNLEGINQVQMNPDIDLNFSAALKSFLRQDPDIIMVGEIRDLETAEISFKAASTGHLVVSTLHTNDAPSTVIRLTEIGIPPYVITSTINLIVAQRLVGKICENCKTPVEMPAQNLITIGVPPNEVSEYKLYKGKGCGTCNNTGIKGRLAIYELLPMTEKVKDAILKGANQAQIRFLARELGLRTLRRSALLKLKRGVTTFEEVLNSSVKDT